MEETSNTTLASIVGGIFAAPFIISKFRAIWSKDGAEAAVGTSIKEMLTTLTDANKELKEENEELHKQINDLRSEVTKFQMLVADLTHQLTKLTLELETNKRIDELARTGKLDRRKKQ
jgi:TolA-binding protein